MPEIVGYSFASGTLLRGRSESEVKLQDLPDRNRPWKSLGRFSIQIIIDTRPFLDALFNLLSPPPNEVINC